MMKIGERTADHRPARCASSIPVLGAPLGDVGGIPVGHARVDGDRQPLRPESPRLLPEDGPARACLSEQLAVQPFAADVDRPERRPSAIAWATRRCQLARVGVPDRPFGRRDRHALDTLDVLGGKVGVVDDEPLRYLPPDAHAAGSVT